MLPNYQPKGDYVAYLGRIIEPKGVHLAIEAIKKYNEDLGQKLKLKIAGKHYAGHKKDAYWQEQIEPALHDPHVEYVGYLQTDAEKQDFLGNARALIVPSTFDEPFGLVVIESLACATPVIGLNSGAIPEIIQDKKTGIVVPHLKENAPRTVQNLAQAIQEITAADRRLCRQDFEQRFTLERMCQEHLELYQKLTG